MSDPLKEKLEKLKKKYGSEEDQEILRGWGKKLKKLAMMEDYIQMEPTQELIDVCERKIKGINNILLNQKELPEEERRALFHERSVWKRILSLYDEEKVKKYREQFSRDLDKKL